MGYPLSDCWYSMRGVALQVCSKEASETHVLPAPSSPSECWWWYTSCEIPHMSGGLQSTFIRSERGSLLRSGRPRLYEWTVLLHMYWPLVWARGPGYRWKIATWLILPVVIRSSQRLSHACLSINTCTLKLRTAHYTSFDLFDSPLLLG